MPSCEKCWRDAGGNADRYHGLLKDREKSPCTPEEQAGVDAHYCTKCERFTGHQYVGVCMNCGAEWPVPGSFMRGHE